MFAIFFTLLTLAVVFGALARFASLVFLAWHKPRAMVAALVSGGTLAALATICLFALHVTFSGSDHEPILGQAGATFALAGFGLGSVAGMSCFALIKIVAIFFRQLVREAP